MPDQRRRRRHPGTETYLAIAATSALILFVVISWAGLWIDPPGKVVLLAMVAPMLPVLISVLPYRLAGLGTIATGAVGGFLVLATATDVSMTSLLKMRRAAWTTLADRIDDGISGAATIAIPLPDDPSSQAVSATLIVLLAMTVFLLAAIGIVTRRPLAAVVTAGVALAYRWTLAPPLHPVLSGATAAALSIVMFAALRRRPDRSFGEAGRTAGLVTAIVAVAAVASLGTGNQAWWNWRSWSWGSANSSGANLLIDQRYGPLNYPDKPIEMLRVKSDRLTPLRATSLDYFDGASFTVGGKYTTEEVLVNGSVDLNPGATGVVRTTTVQLTATSSKWLFAGGPPTRIEGLGSRSLLRYDDGSLEADPDLERGTSVTLTTVTPDPGPRKLLDYRGDFGFDLSPLRIDSSGPPIAVPHYGYGTLPTSAFGTLAPVARLSRDIIGDASSQYEAVNRMEGYLRANYRYDTSVPSAASPQDELRNFLLSTKTGYCQHFAGSMALMLRMNGIPARVAVGVNVSTGSYDPASKSYVVTDRDAHSWVEVYFGDEYGWLAFDPTPSRFASGNSASVSSGNYVPPTGTNVPPKLSRAPVKPAVKPAAPTPEPTAIPDAPTGDGFSWRWPAVLGLGLLVLITPAAVKTVRRARRRSGTERDQVLGAARELESWLVDLGVPTDPAATPAERVETTRRTLGIDTAGIYGSASAARFSGRQPASGAGTQAWRELRTIQRGLGKRARVGAALRSRSLFTRDGATATQAGQITVEGSSPQRPRRFRGRST